MFSTTTKLTLWRILDGFICIFILAPLVVFYWRGSFQVLDVYTYPSNLTISSTISAIIGITGTVAVNISQGFLERFIHGLSSIWLQILCKRIYTYIYGWIIVHHWRGIWRLWDAVTTTSVTSGITSFLVGCGVLIMMKSFRNVVAPPLVTVSDFDRNYFVVKTRFRTKPTKFGIYLLDNLFSILVPGSLVVSVWRGQWSILDHVLLMDTLFTSCLISGAIGFGLTVTLFFLQWPAAWTSRSLELSHWHWLKLIFEDSFYYLACFAAVNIWRSIWGLCDVLILVDNYALSNWTCHLIGAFGTMLLLHGNTVLVRDVQIDGEFTDGKGLFFFSKSLTLLEQRSGLFTVYNDAQIVKSVDHPSSNNINIAPDIVPSSDPVIMVKKHDYLEPSSRTDDGNEREQMLEQRLENPRTVIRPTKPLE